MDANEYVNEMVKEYGKMNTLWQLSRLKGDYFHENDRYPTKEEFYNYFDGKLGTSTITESAARAMALNNQYPEKEIENNSKKNYFNKDYKLFN